MKRNGFLVYVIAVVAAGCATAPPIVPITSPAPARVGSAVPASSPLIATIEPARVIYLAAEAAAKGQLVRSRFTVQATGAERDLIYLNSERDYRDQRNLTVVILPSAANGLRETLGPDLRAALEGKSITVTGVAKRVTVWFVADGKKTNKYYYQTQLVVSNPRQLQVGGDEG